MHYFVVITEWVLERGIIACCLRDLCCLSEILLYAMSRLNRDADPQHYPSTQPSIHYMALPMIQAHHHHHSSWWGIKLVAVHVDEGRKASLDALVSRCLTEFVSLRVVLRDNVELWVG